MTTYNDTGKRKLIINKATKTQFDNATNLSEDELYLIDPEFNGNKLLATDNNGEIVETAFTPTDVVSDVQINGTTITTDGVANIPIAAAGVAGAIGVSTTYACSKSGVNLFCSAISEANYSTLANQAFISKGTLENIKNSYVRSVYASYTEITASSATYTLSSNATFGQTPSQAVTYTLPTVIAGVDNWCKLFVDCTTTASIAFTTADSTTITPVGSPTITQGNSYIFVCQYDNLAETWKVFLVDATV